MQGVQNLYRKRKKSYLSGWPFRIIMINVTSFICLLVEDKCTSIVEGWMIWCAFPLCLPPPPPDFQRLFSSRYVHFCSLFSIRFLFSFLLKIGQQWSTTNPHSEMKSSQTIKSTSCSIHNICKVASCSYLKMHFLTLGMCLALVILKLWYVIINCTVKPQES